MDKHFRHEGSLGHQKASLRDRSRQDKINMKQDNSSLGRKPLERVGSRVESRCGSGDALEAQMTRRRLSQRPSLRPAASAKHSTMFGTLCGLGSVDQRTVARHDTLLNSRFVGDWVLSIRGCKARHDASNILLVEIGFCRSGVARQGTTQRTFCLWIGFCRSGVARQGTTLRTFCLWGLGSVDQGLQGKARRFEHSACGDWVLSIRGCKARHDASNILLVGIGFWVARQGTTLRTFCLWGLGSVDQGLQGKARRFEHSACGDWVLSIRGCKARRFEHSTWLYGCGVKTVQ